MTDTSFSMIKVNDHHLAVVETRAISNNKKIVIFCHGFRSSSIGPNRFFVRAAEKFTELGIDTLRFDQYGSGNSEGDFIDSSFSDWIRTTITLAERYLHDGYQVALFGQSMGGATVIAAGAQLKDLSAVVAWAPDPSIDSYEGDGTGFHEEGGERVGEDFWMEAHAANIPVALHALSAPTYIVQCGKDEYVSAANHHAIKTNARKNHIVEMFPDLPHSAWTFEQATTIIEKSASFIAKGFGSSAHRAKPSTPHLKKSVEILCALQEKGVPVVLYGSTGASYYLGDFKAEFGDIDLLLDDVWIDEKWDQLQLIMKDMGYRLVDEHEHEFSHPSSPDVAFAGKSILLRDGVLATLGEIVEVTVDGVTVQTLPPGAFLRAYEFSLKDGYRIKNRKKDDAKVISLLKFHIAKRNAIR